MKKLILSSAIVLLAVTSLWAQTEICDNGIDDDFDGFIDCYDPDCSNSATSINSSACDGFYLGNDVACEVVPSQFPKFTMTLDFASPNETTNHIGRMSIGDIDRDGIPEIVTMNRYSKMLYVLSGSDGSIKRSKSVSFTPLWEIALGNIDNDNCAELYFQGLENSGKELYIYAYDCDLNLIWKTLIYQDGSGDAMDALMYGLADFDGDGKVELYVKDMILDAHTGTIIVNTSTTSDSEWLDMAGGAVAVDMMGDADLELVLGCKIYDVNLGARTAGSGTLTLLKSLPQYKIKYHYNATSVADYNQDGFLDVVASGGEDIGGRIYTTVFFWDVQNDTYKTFSDPIDGTFNINGCPPSSGSYYKRGWVSGTGRINIADLDGDEKLDVSFVSGKFLYALDENFNLLWRITVNEETSGYTGCTLFDFNGDGKSEVVYRDERLLYIINGTDGTIFSQQPCISRTNREYPIVADVDADGSTELCVTCGFNDVDAANNFCDLSYSQYSHVRVYKSAAEPWVPARRLWNQHGYFNVNVNDDLTIPRRQQKHHLVWSSGNCTIGPNRPLNNFLNQSPFLNSQGCPTYAAPDLAMVPGSLTITNPTCPDKDFIVSFKFTNAGDIELSGDVPLTFYKGNPFQAGSKRLNTVTLTLNNFSVGDTLTQTNVTVNGDGSFFQLWAILNDPGTDPLALTWPLASSPIAECPNDNNKDFADVEPLPVAITALKVQDNLKCVGSTTPDNGAVRAFVPVGGVENIADYNFYWSNGAVAKPVASADHTGASYNQLATGDYTVYAIHKTAQCNSDTATVNVGQINNQVTVDIQLTNPYTNCKNPNGKLTAIVNGGAPPGNYKFEWYEGNDIFTGIILPGDSPIAADLFPITYTVLVTDKATGCQSIESFTVPDQSVKPVVDVTKGDLSCAANATADLSASVGGQTSGYSFDWYNGSVVKPTPDFTGSSNLKPGGTYTVVATRTTTQCSSDPVTVTIVQTTPPVASASTVANQTSCDALLPNGSVTSNVGGQTNGYSFEWFKGQSTLPADLVGTTNALSGLASGVYTVRVTDDVTQCSDTEEVTVANNVVTPAILIGAVANSTNCTTPNGSVTVNVTLDALTDYTFFWYDGTSVKASPDYPDTDNVLSGVVPGDYTVTAIHNTKHCEAAPVTATIGDDAPPISIIVDETVTKYPTDCSENDGEMVVDISAPGNVGKFDVEWYSGIAPFSAPPFQRENNVVRSSADSLSAGIYTVKATNRDNGCSNQVEITLPFAFAQALNFVAKGDVTTCSPANEGFIEVELIPTPLPGFTEADYDIHVYSGTSDISLAWNFSPPPPSEFVEAINGVAGTSNYTTNNLSPGPYTLVAISKSPLTDGCRSVPVKVDIQQTAPNPVITAAPVQANTFCGSPGSGRIDITQVDGTTNFASYTFKWYEGTDTSAPNLGIGTSGTTAGSVNGEIARDLETGPYTVEVINNVTLCPSTANFVIQENRPILTVASNDLVVTPHTMCNGGSGTAEVLNVMENDGTTTTSFSPALYTFEWLDINQNPLPDAITPETSASIANLLPGDYYVRATRTLSSCATSLKQFNVPDQTAADPTVTLTSFAIPSQCLKGLDPSDPQYDPITHQRLGRLVVEAAGNGANFTYEWYTDSLTKPFGTPDFTGPDLNPITVPPGQSKITYTLHVVNNVNQCDTVEYYTLPLEVVPITVFASATPVTFCDVDNGEVFARIPAGFTNEYDFYWSIGSAAKPIPADLSPNTVYSGLAAGDYTVVAVDQLDASCVSPPVTVQVGTDQSMPVVTVTGRSPVTNCDTTIPNGSASASVDGDVANYEFKWFEGTTIPDPNAPLFIGSDIGDLEAKTYTVLATNLITGCQGTAQVTINYSPAVIPPVEITVLSNMTSCVGPNGVLTASVNGNTLDYTFDWSIGSEVKPVPDFTGPTWTNLDVGTYTVIATNNATGCQTPKDTDNIIEDLSYPDFDFIVVNSACSEDANGDGMPDDAPSGFVTLEFKSNVNIASVVWTDAGGNIIPGVALGGVDAGVYHVTVTSDLGCPTSKDVLVKSEIRPYNGISRNGDGMNERFHINCIEDFPDNVVKIYNRAGTLVYQKEGYDNIDIYFDGRSNEGINVMGNNLPDGTYFYVIDKRDGSKPVAGYLEIVN